MTMTTTKGKKKREAINIALLTMIKEKKTELMMKTKNLR